jgi:hypothetical protein
MYSVCPRRQGPDPKDLNMAPFTIGSVSIVVDLLGSSWVQVHSIHADYPNT